MKIMADIHSLLSAAPYFSEANVGEELYRKMKALEAAMKEQSIANSRLLNNENVTGIWYLTCYDIEGEAALIVRTSLKEARDVLLMTYELSEFMEQGIVYDYNTDLVSDENVMVGTSARLRQEIEEGRVLTVYDKERED